MDDSADDTLHINRLLQLCDSVVVVEMKIVGSFPLPAVLGSKHGEADYAYHGGLGRWTMVLFRTVP